MANISIYEAIGRNLGDVVKKGIPTGATATTMDSNVLVHPLAGQLKGNELYIYEGTGVGQTRTITDYTPTNSRITVSPPFTTIPTADSRFIVFKHFSIEDYENAMNRGIGQARLVHRDEKVATMQIVATQYEYAVPSGFEYISALRLVPTSGTDYGEDDEVSGMFEFAPRFWRIEPTTGGSYVIVFDRRKIDLDSYDEEMVKVVGQVKPDFGASLIADELQEYVINKATMLLSSQRIGEGQEWRAKFYTYRTIVTELETYIHSSRFGKRVGV